MDLFNEPDTPHHYDLLELQDGLTADLTGVVDVDKGVYSDLRLVVDSARVTLVEDFKFTDGMSTTTLTVPSAGSPIN